MFNVALPNCDHAPTVAYKDSRRAAIACSGCVDLFTPEYLTALGIDGLGASEMVMPKTSVHKYCCSVFRQDNVGLSRKLAYVDAESKATPMKKGSHYAFR